MKKTAVMSLDSAFKKDENYYPQSLYIKTKLIRHIVDDLESFSDYSDEE